MTLVDNPLSPFLTHTTKKIKAHFVRNELLLFMGIKSFEFFNRLTFPSMNRNVSLYLILFIFNLFVILLSER